MFKIKFSISFLIILNSLGLIAQSNNFSNEKGFISISGGLASPVGSFAGKSKQYEFDDVQGIKIQQNGGFATLGYNFKLTAHSYLIHKNIPLVLDGGILVNPIDKNNLMDKTFPFRNDFKIKSDNWIIPYLAIGIGYRFIFKKFSLHATILGGISYCSPPQVTISKDQTVFTTYSKVRYQGIINGIYGGSVGLLYQIGTVGLLLETVFLNTIDQNYKCSEEYGNSFNNPSLSNFNSSFTINGNAKLGIHSVLINLGVYYPIYKK